ncbi:Hypothetical protein SCF082_LOCUS52284 [Durusdinium trenchii]|uniref:Uncharacterized protein n=1 Tax=Durusdinium trenchii TaxID=1381693 RepID=A0ABP0SKK9_9DINO
MTLRARTSALLSSDLSDLYDGFAIGWNELFDQEPTTSIARHNTQRIGTHDGHDATYHDHDSSTQPPKLAPLQCNASKGKNKRVPVPPPYLRIGGGKRSIIDRVMKERVLTCPVNQIRKPAEVVEVELDQLRAQLQKELRERRRDARRRRHMRRRCRLQEGEDLDAAEANWKLEPLERLSPRSDRQQSARSFFSQLGHKRLGDVSAPQTAR